LQSKIPDSPALANKNLLEWTNLWINKAGANHIETEVKGNGKVYLRQTFPKHGDQVYREQTIDVGIFDKKGSLIEIIKNVKIPASGDLIFIYELNKH
jgi:hypothetical protein